MARFSDILYELAAPFGAGLQKGINEEEALRSQERGFERLAPIRERQRAEALAGKRGELELKDEFQATEERGLADLARSMGFPLETTTMPTPERAEMEFGVTTPIERLPKAGIPLLTAAARSSATKPARLSVPELLVASQTPGHPLASQGQAYIKGAAQAAGTRQAAVTPEQAVPAGVQTALADLEALTGTVKDVRGRFKAEYLSPQRGGTAWLREGKLNQLAGGMLMGPDEQTFRAATADIADRLLRARSGAQINETEYRRLSKIAPNLNTPPANFLAQLERFELEMNRVLESKRRLATTSRGRLLSQSPRGVVTVPGFGSSIFVEETDEEETE